MVPREQRQRANGRNGVRSGEGHENDRRIPQAPSFRRRKCQRQNEEREKQPPVQVPDAAALDDAGAYHLSRRRHRSGRRGAKVLSATRRRYFPSSLSPTSLLLAAAAALYCLSSTAFGLVIEEPFQETFDHVAAAFGPDLLNMEPPMESRSLIRARPRDGCTPLLNAMDEGAIALVERGTCNFTQKVLHAQEAGASAVVVTDTRATDQWLMVMYGDPENTQGIEIPSVLVSHATGERLWSNRSWIPGRQGKLRASVGASGHIVMTTRAMSPMEMVGIYLLLSVLLLAFSSICGLMFALAFTWYQRGYRTRALRKLKSFTFRRRTPRPSPSPLEPQNSAADSSNTGGAKGTAGATSGRTESSSAAAASAAVATPPLGSASENDPSLSSSAAHEGTTAPADSPLPRRPNDSEFMRGAEDDMCAICLETYEDGDSLTGLPCRHSFHTQCIGPWLSGKSALCPMCKTEAFGKGSMFRTTGPMLEAAFAELASLCTENLAVLGLFFLASVACGVIAAKLSLRD
ncbi:unnamed protein product [Scytosiphon promiscuus]